MTAVVVSTGLLHEWSINDFFIYFHKNQGPISLLEPGVDTQGPDYSGELPVER